MNGNPTVAHHARQWRVGFCMAAVGVAAAVIGVATAHADSIDQLFTQAEDDMTKAANLLLAEAGDPSLSAKEASGLDSIASAAQHQGELISQIQSSQDGLPAADQTNPLLLGADQQLVQASDAFLSANNTYVDAVQAGDFPLHPGDFAGASAALSLAGVELFQVFPAEIDALLAPLALGVIPAFDVGCQE